MKKKTRKNGFVISAAALCAFCMLTFTACGSSNSNTAEVYTNYAGEGVQEKGYSNDMYESADSYDSELNLSTDSAAEGNAAAGNPDKAEETINMEMLVYSCNMTVDTLNFDEALSGFRAALDRYGGFVETENYSDGGGSGKWYKEGEQKWKSFTATVRIPSGSYEEFVNLTGDLGYLRSKTAGVENLSREYSDLSTTLEIYLAKEERYIARLSEITDEAYALQVEKELTDIQIQIANIRNRMSTIRTDVAYSYVYFTLNEVKEYASEPEEPVKTDTFGERLSVTVKTATRGFLRFMEILLFAFIYAAPYLMLFGVTALIVITIAKAYRKRHSAMAGVAGAAGTANPAKASAAPNIPHVKPPVNPPIYNAAANYPQKNPENNPPKAFENNPPKTPENNPPKAPENNPPKAPQNNSPKALENNPPKKPDNSANQSKKPDSGKKDNKAK